MANSINMGRIAKRLSELYEGKIDLSDIKEGEKYHFETRAIAALALEMMTDIGAQQSPIHITDGYHDLGIDAIYLDELQKRLFVVQSKWRNDGSGSISQTEMSTFVEGLKRVLNMDLNGANKRITEKKADIDFALTTIDYQIQAIFIHTGNVDANQYVLRPIKELMEETNDEISTILTFREIKFKDIYDFLAKGQDPDGINVDDVIINNWGVVNEPYISYYGVISAATLGKWYKQHGNSLFAKNIRYYKGSTAVNEGMKKVLISEPENFYYYNNGIKILCNSIKRKAKESTNNSTGLFSLEGISLVNGAQTTGVIGSVYTENTEQLSKAYVMVELIDLTSITNETALQITKLSNTQNRIENKDFAALDPEQERIRKELDFAHYTYLYKGGDRITKPGNQISLEEAVVALACWNSDVSYSTIAKGNIGALTEDISKAPYKVLFNSSTNSYVLLNSVIVLREVERYLNKKKECSLNVDRERLVCIHGNRLISHIVLQNLRDQFAFDKTVIDEKILNSEVDKTINEITPRVAIHMNAYFPTSYPASIFKNNTKCKKINEEMEREKTALKNASFN